MTNKTALLAPSNIFHPSTDSQIRQSFATPYGVAYGKQIDDCLWLEPASAHATIYAAKDAGCVQIVEVAYFSAVNRLLAPGDIFLPSDVIDLTYGQEYTFFIGKGYGFLPQNPPFCPYLRSTLFQALHDVSADWLLSERPALFRRGTYAALNYDNTTPADLQAWNIDAVGTAGVPAVFLARELEMCYALVGCMCTNQQSIIQQSIVLHALQKITQGDGKERSCRCQVAMQTVRERGLVGNDWHSWIGTNHREE